MFPAGKSAEKTPAKSIEFISNDYCRICRINLKISGRSKINIFGSKRDNKEFLKTLSLVLSKGINDATGLSQIVCQKCQREVLKFSRILEQGKELALFREKCDEAVRTQLEEYQLQRQKRCAKDSPTTRLDRQGKKSSLSKPSDQRTIRRALIPKKSTDENFAPNNIHVSLFCDTLFDGSQESSRTGVTEVR